jgi:hypothetical protein
VRAIGRIKQAHRYVADMVVAQIKSFKFTQVLKAMWLYVFNFVVPKQQVLEISHLTKLVITQISQSIVIDAEHFESIKFDMMQK